MSDVKNVIIWGNQISSQYPDARLCVASQIPLKDLIGDEAEEWANDEFIANVQTRGQDVVKARKVL